MNGLGLTANRGGGGAWTGRHLQDARRRAGRRPRRHPGCLPAPGAEKLSHRLDEPLGGFSRRALESLEWLERAPIGGPYRDEIDVILRSTGRRRSAEAEASERRGLFRRR